MKIKNNMSNLKLEVIGSGWMGDWEVNCRYN